MKEPARNQKFCDKKCYQEWYNKYYRPKHLIDEKKRYRNRKIPVYKLVWKCQECGQELYLEKIFKNFKPPECLNKKNHR